MNARGFVQRHRALRWVAPIGIAGVAAVAASGVLNAHATSKQLPHTTPTSLLAGVQTSHVDGFSGTVVSHLSLGLPQLPAIGNTGDGSSPMSLLTGSHTMQIWYGGLTKQRLALLGATDETDLFRDGRQLWQWNSATRTAVHTVLRKGAAPISTPTSGPSASTSGPSASTSAAASLTPEQLARRALDAMDPTTDVRVAGHDTVADRSTYDLVLTPRTATRVGSVHISVDGETKMPLAVQVFARGAAAPAIDVAFTSINYGVPAERNFTFSPPPNARVHTTHDKRHQDGTQRHDQDGSHRDALTRPTHLRVIGSGWSRVLAASVPPAAARKIERSSALTALEPVSGTWGKGRLLDSSLVTMLITTDGRVFAGAVEPNVLYAAAGTK